MQVVDAFVHLFRPVSPDYPRPIHPGLRPADGNALVEDLLDDMDDVGVNKAVVIPVSEHDQYLQDVVLQHEHRFAAVGVYDPHIEDQIRDLDRRISESKIQGLRFFEFGNPELNPQSLPTYPVLAALREREMQVWVYSRPDQLELLERILETLPGLKVVINHLGFSPGLENEDVDEHSRPKFDIDLPPESLKLVKRIAEHSSAYVVLSGEYAFSNESYPYDDVKPVVEEVYQMFGADRMMWGSDWPEIRRVPGYKKQLALVDLFLPEITTEEADMIRGGTALSLLDFG